MNILQNSPYVISLALHTVMELQIIHVPKSEDDHLCVLFSCSLSFDIMNYNLHLNVVDALESTLVNNGPLWFIF